MYIPNYYKETDFDTLFAFMKSHSFAILVSSGNNLQATHLPFVIEKREEKIYLVSHQAKVNPQWQQFNSSNELLVIFQGPHGYVSPTHYEKKQNVPTWNYIAVHAYGKATIIESSTAVINVLEKMIMTYEPHYYKQWQELSQEYINGMIQGITAFEIEVTKLEGQYKLSQNKTQNEKQAIIVTFDNTNDCTLSELGKEMKKRL